MWYTVVVLAHQDSVILISILTVVLDRGKNNNKMRIMTLQFCDSNQPD